MTIIFGLLSAFSLGYADFFGALAAKKVRALSVTASAFLVGLILAIVLALPIGATFSLNTIQLGALAGVASAIGISCLYAALALGPISIVSPFTAVASAVIPVIVDVALGEELAGSAGIAIVLILLAVVLVAFVPGQEVKLPSLPAVIYSLGASIGFAAIFLLLDAAEPTSGLGPLIVMRVVGIVLLFAGLTALWLRNKEKAFLEKEILQPKLFLLIALAGLGDVTGNVFFLVATREGALAISAVLTSLYPVATILLARIVLKERIAKSQSIGILLGMTAVGILALS